MLVTCATHLQIIEACSDGHSERFDPFEGNTSCAAALAAVTTGYETADSVVKEVLEYMRVHGGEVASTDEGTPVYPLSDTEPVAQNGELGNWWRIHYDAARKLLVVVWFFEDGDWSTKLFDAYDMRRTAG